MRWLRMAWRETAGGLRALSLALWAVGGALLGFGWWGDQVGFWADKPFITNVFSSVTAVSFGVPLALIVVGRVGGAQAGAVGGRGGRGVGGQGGRGPVLPV